MVNFVLRPLILPLMLLLILLTSLVAPLGTAHAWDVHQTLMAAITNDDLQVSEVSKRPYLNQMVKTPCANEEEQVLGNLAAQLLIREEKIPRYAKKHDCAKAQSVLSLISGDFVDEPDQGMDQELPEQMNGQAIDPKGDRPHMGGLKGMTSQGFRHMFFPGISWSQPLVTLQFPFRKLGQAPERFEKIKAVSDQFFKEGKMFWGIRTLMWSFHYLQDLYQPFHTRQVPALDLLPVSFNWSPKHDFHQLEHFVASATHAIVNYHLAYEGLAMAWVQNLTDDSFRACFQINPEASQNVPQNRPENIIEGVVAYSSSKANRLGKNLALVFPTEIQNADFDLNRPDDPDTIDYDNLISSAEHEDADPAFKQALKEVRETTCDLMKQMTMATWGELDRAFNQVTSNSAKTGK